MISKHDIDESMIIIDTAGTEPYKHSKEFDCFVLVWRQLIKYGLIEHKVYDELSNEDKKIFDEEYEYALNHYDQSEPLKSLRFLADKTK